jgi:hypothetical protein
MPPPGPPPGSTPLSRQATLAPRSDPMASAADAEPAKKRRIVEDEDEEMEEAPAAIVPTIKENRAQPLPGQQEEFSPELLRM